MDPKRVEISLFVALDEADDNEALAQSSARQLGVSREDIFAITLLRRSLDVRRGRRAGHRLKVAVHLGGLCEQSATPRKRYRLAKELRVVVAGSGPTGTFAALRLAEAGASVVIAELGKAVQPRRLDIAKLVRDGELEPTSNYCFGEGGAGTFSDGKLYTRTKNRLAVAEVIATLVEFGADPRIRVESRPHIGSDRLPKVLTLLRGHLEQLGVNYRFSDPLVDFAVRDGRIVGANLGLSGATDCQAMVVAAGHSARSLFATLVDRGVAHESKPFAVGARIEHPQQLIDQLQYGDSHGSPRLPAAFYHITAQSKADGVERGIYSFCMCPGGWVVNSSTEPGLLCTNGMSLKRRDSPRANAAFVVSVQPEDVASFGRFPGDPLAGIAFQQEIESRAFQAGGGGFVAPAQRLNDFAEGRSTSTALPTSYRPGVVGGTLDGVLPPFVTKALREALPQFERKMRGFHSDEAQLIGVETRTSSPLRFIRDPSTLMSVSHPGLYPGGEGAGYAGGIVSAAVDGLRIADAILQANGAEVLASS